MAERSSTYDLSSVLRALGVRTARAVPSIAAIDLLPVVVVGDFSTTFASEVIESRGTTVPLGTLVTANVWGGVYIQSLAPGGIVVERIRGNPDPDSLVAFGIHSGGVPLWAGGTFEAILPTGGGSVASRFNYIVSQPLPFPSAALATRPNAVQFGLSPAYTAPLQYTAFERWWIPPGWHLSWWTITNTNYAPSFVFREIPEAQGPV